MTDIPWPGPRTQVVIHNGHAPGHAAVFLPETGVLLAGDMLSDVEIPLPDLAMADPLGDYHAGLDGLRPCWGCALSCPVMGTWVTRLSSAAGSALT